MEENNRLIILEKNYAIFVKYVRYRYCTLKKSVFRIRMDPGFLFFRPSGSGSGF